MSDADRATQKSEVRVRCEGAGLVKIDDLLPFQGNLVELSEEGYRKLKNEIIDDGFSDPFDVWKQPSTNKLYVLDGHQRLSTLKRMRQEGWTVPELPLNWIEADDMRQAKRKLLAFRSRFGKMTSGGLAEFMKTSGIEFQEVAASFEFPEINFAELAPMFNTFPPRSQGAEGETPTFAPGTEGEQGKLDEKVPIECPSCGHKFHK